MEIKLSKSEVIYFRSKIKKYGKSNFDTFPWRFTKNMWHALTAEIMLRRTKAEQVLPVYENFCAVYEKPDDYLVKKNSSIFKQLGLPQREREFLELTKIIVESGIPGDKTKLLELPGIGDYISSAFLSFHLNKREVIIDSNIVRLYGRYFGFETNGETRRKKWFINLADILTPKRSFKSYNYGLLDFTRKVCKPKPNCIECILNRRCNYYRNLMDMQKGR